MNELPSFAWDRRVYSLESFIDDRRSTLPCVVQTAEGFCPELEEDTLENGQTLILHEIRQQQFAVVTNPNGAELCIPVTCPVKVELVPLDRLNEEYTTVEELFMAQPDYFRVLDDIPSLDIKSGSVMEICSRQNGVYHLKCEVVDHASPCQEVVKLPLTQHGRFRPLHDAGEYLLEEVLARYPPPSEIGVRFINSSSTGSRPFTSDTHLPWGSGLRVQRASHDETVIATTAGDECKELLLFSKTLDISVVPALDYSEQLATMARTCAFGRLVEQAMKLNSLRPYHGSCRLRKFGIENLMTPSRSFSESDLEINTSSGEADDQYDKVLSDGPNPAPPLPRRQKRKKRSLRRQTYSRRLVGDEVDYTNEARNTLTLPLGWKSLSEGDLYRQKAQGEGNNDYNETPSDDINPIPLPPPRQIGKSISHPKLLTPRISEQTQKPVPRLHKQSDKPIANPIPLPPRLHKQSGNPMSNPIPLLPRLHKKSDKIVSNTIPRDQRPSSGSSFGMEETARELSESEFQSDSEVQSTSLTPSHGSECLRHSLSRSTSSDGCSTISLYANESEYIEIPLEDWNDGTPEQLSADELEETHLEINIPETGQWSCGTGAPKEVRGRPASYWYAYQHFGRFQTYLSGCNSAPYVNRPLLHPRRQQHSDSVADTMKKPINSEESNHREDGACGQHKTLLRKKSRSEGDVFRSGFSTTEVRDLDDDYYVEFLAGVDPDAAYLEPVDAFPDSLGPNCKRATIGTEGQESHERRISGDSSPEEDSEGSDTLSYSYPYMYIDGFVGSISTTMSDRASTHTDDLGDDTERSKPAFPCWTVHTDDQNHGCPTPDKITFPIENKEECSPCDSAVVSCTPPVPPRKPGKGLSRASNEDSELVEGPISGSTPPYQKPRQDRKNLYENTQYPLATEVGKEHGSCTEDGGNEDCEDLSSEAEQNVPIVETSQELKEVLGQKRMTEKKQKDDGDANRIHFPETESAIIIQPSDSQKVELSCATNSRLLENGEGEEDSDLKVALTDEADYCAMDQGEPRERSDSYSYPYVHFLFPRFKSAGRTATSQQRLLKGSPSDRADSEQDIPELPHKPTFLRPLEETWKIPQPDSVSIAPPLPPRRAVSPSVMKEPSCTAGGGDDEGAYLVVDLLDDLTPHDYTEIEDLAVQGEVVFPLEVPETCPMSQSEAPLYAPGPPQRRPGKSVEQDPSVVAYDGVYSIIPDDQDYEDYDTGTTQVTRPSPPRNKFSAIGLFTGKAKKKKFKQKKRTEEKHESTETRPVQAHIEHLPTLSKHHRRDHREEFEDLDTIRLFLQMRDRQKELEAAISLQKATFDAEIARQKALSPSSEQGACTDNIINQDPCAKILGEPVSGSRPGRNPPFGDADTVDHTNELPLGDSSGDARVAQSTSTEPAGSCPESHETRCCTKLRKQPVLKPRKRN